MFHPATSAAICTTQTFTYQQLQIFSFIIAVPESYFTAPTLLSVTPTVSFTASFRQRRATLTTPG